MEAQVTERCLSTRSPSGTVVERQAFLSLESGLFRGPLGRPSQP